GMPPAAPVSQFPQVVPRIIERRDGPFRLGPADGIQARRAETLQALRFGGRSRAGAYNIGWMKLWNPGPGDPSRIVRTSRTEDYGFKISEFPHLIVNQARVLDYFAEAARNGPGRIVPDYGVEMVDLKVTDDGEYPVEVSVRYTAGEREGETR